MSTSEQPLIIYGAGGHGLVVAEAARDAGHEVLGFLDDEREPGSTIEGRVVLNPDEIPAVGEVVYHIAIGDNKTRFEVLQRLKADGARFRTIIHPAAVVNRLATVMDGAFIGARAVVNPRALVGQAAIVNTGAIVEHHASVDMCAHVGPGAVLTGRAFLGKRSLAGAGSVLNPGVRVADDVVIGAGAVVTANVSAGYTIKGVPAR